MIGDGGLTDPAPVADVAPVDEPEQAAPKAAAVSLLRLRAASSGTGRYLSGVKAVQGALAQLRFLPDTAPATGLFDSSTMSAYRALQLHLGFSNERANGHPDQHSLTWLALRTGRFQMERV